MRSFQGFHRQGTRESGPIKAGSTMFRGGFRIAGSGLTSPCDICLSLFGANAGSLKRTLMPEDFQNV